MGFLEGVDQVSQPYFRFAFHLIKIILHNLSKNRNLSLTIKLFGHIQSLNTQGNEGIFAQ